MDFLAKTNVMLDMETMSTHSTAAIVSIGATKFNSTGIIDKFYTTVSLKDCKERGLHVSKDTLKWWSEQNQTALADILTNAKPLEDGIKEFANWYGNYSLTIWSNGAAFDIPIIENAMGVVGEPIPWKYYDVRCMRTLVALFKDVVNPPVREGTYHNALDDAIFQTKYVIDILSA